MSATLTQAQRVRLASRPVAILRVLILDMVGAAEAAALASLYSDPAVTSAAWHAVDSAMLHAHTALALYVGNDVSMLYAWDSVEDAFDDRAALATWRARLAAALAIPEPAADVPGDYMEILRAAGYNTVDEILRTREDALACVVGIGPILAVRIKRELRAKRESP